jgi:predicted N-acyltransferase
MEPGAGGGEFKYLRGFDPYIVNSVHYIENMKFRNAVRDFLEQEGQHNTELTSFLVAKSKKQVN